MKEETSFDKMLELDKAIDQAKALWWDKFFLSMCDYKEEESND